MIYTKRPKSKLLFVSNFYTASCYLARMYSTVLGLSLWLEKFTRENYFIHAIIVLTEARRPIYTLV